MATRSLTFPNEDALRVAIGGALLPPAVLSAPARVARAKDGAIAVGVSEALPRAALDALKAAGVEVAAGSPDHARDVTCWAEILPPRRLPEVATGRSVLFAIPDGARAPLDLAGELLRLGCDRQDLAFQEGQAYLRAAQPPYYSVACAIDRPGGMRAFVPSPPGQEHVWTEVGFEHPLGAVTKPPAGQLLLIDGDGVWHQAPNGPWTDLYKLVELRLPGDVAPLPAGKLPARLQVPLRLTRAAREQAPSLWVLREHATATIDQLVQNLPDEIIGRLLFAASGDKDPTVVLRARPSQKGPPELVVPGEAYVPLLQLGNLYAPAGTILEPPLRRERVRDLLAPRPEQVAWLAPGEGGAFRVETVEETAFAPLEDWVEYVIHSRAAEIEPWVRAATFELDTFESVGSEWTDKRPRGEDEDDEEKQEKGKKGKKGKKAARDEAYADDVAEAKPSVAKEKVVAYVPELQAVKIEEPSVAEKQLADLERKFLDLDSPADDPERSKMWMQMAGRHVSLKRGRDFGLCATRALWEVPPAESRAVAAQWAAMEGQLSGADPLALLGQRNADRDDARAFAATLYSAAVAAKPPVAITGRLHDVQVWLDQHDDSLDVRSLWLARWSVAKLVGGDRLGLARTRDRILQGLHRGLSLERDVPTFLRFIGGAGAGQHADATAATRLLAQLEGLLGRFEKTERKRHVLDTAVVPTRAYVLFTFAYGFARLGQAERAHKLREVAEKLLDVKDPVHGFLARAYSARVDQALEGLAPETALPGPVAAELNQLEKFFRYKVDRLRQHARVLEPQENLDPIGAFHKNAADSRGEDFAPLRGLSDVGEINAAVEKLLKKAVAKGTKVEDRDRIFDGAMDFFPQLPESDAVPKLQLIVDNVDDVVPERRAMLLEEALLVSGFFGRADLVRDILKTLRKLLGELGAEHIASFGKVLERSLRSLRRVGLGDEAGELLAAIEKASAGKSLEAVIGRLQLASGFASLGKHDRAEALLGEGRAQLKDKALAEKTVERLRITAAMAAAYSQSPHEVAFAGITQLAGELVTVTDKYNTNSHFCLSAIQFMESLILALASEDLALGEVGRRWLEEDEYLVRRRVHRDLGEQT